MISREEIKEKYPIHWLVWNNEITELDKFLENPKVNTYIMDLWFIEFFYTILGVRSLLVQIIDWLRISGGLFRIQLLVREW